MLKFRNLFVLGIVLLSFGFSFAQVIYETTTVSNGIQGMMAFKSTSKIELTADKKRSTTQTEFTGSFMKHFNPKSAQVEIVRLDQELFWNLNSDKKEYTEMTFAELRKLMEAGIPEAPGMPQQEEPAAADREDEYEWEAPVVKVTEGGTQTVNGFKCQNYLVQVTTVGKHKKTGIKDTILVANDLWNSVVEAKAMTQIKNFDLSLAQKLGFERQMPAMGSILSAHKEYFEQIAEKTKNLKGYPIKSNFKMTMTTHAQKDARSQPTAEKEAAPDLTKNPVGGLLGGFAKKMAKSATQKSAGGSQEMFQFTHEIKSIQMGSIAEDEFNVPANFKKVAKPEAPPVKEKQK
ncbi:hypothetical protein L0128_11020 [candidate division KSB1 bacterium]|nr:hypothetical protein [candidate division KSB1 bacterium]